MPLSSEREVVRRLAEEGLNASPDAVARIAGGTDPEALVRALARRADGPVVTREDVVEAAEGFEDADTEHTSSDDPPSSDPPDRPAGREDAGGSPDTSRSEDARTDGALSPDDPRGTPSDPPPDTSTSGPSSPGPSSVGVTNDITGESTCTGEYADFVGYFRDRFDRLSSLLRSRIQPRTVDSAASGGKDVSLVGMVNDVRTTSSDRDNRLVEIEDPTGEIRLLLSDELVDVAETLVVDEVIGVEGRLSDDGGMVFVDDVHFPEVPPRREPSTASRDVKAVLISDIHVGSETFVRDHWDLFADWLSRQEDVEYLLVGGDMVEGVGVYPGQDEELTTVDIYEQYRDCAEMFDALPDDIEILTITGNHDSVRLAEPQPALDDRFREPFGDNVSFHGNPSVVTVEGVDVLMYHGMSLNPFAESVPHVEIESPETAMVEMLRKRHLAPMYGDVRLAPEKEDYLVIDDVPDVLHTGHTHTVGAERYRNVLTVNTGAWQAQTPYQKSMNIHPDVGYAAVLDLSTLELELKEFAP
jgi:DNA polymerase II small subunit